MSRSLLDASMAVASTPLVAAPSCPAWAKRRRGRQPQFDGKPCEPAEEEDMWLCLADGRARSTADLKRLATRGETRRRWRRRRRQRHARADGFGLGGAATAWAAAALSARACRLPSLRTARARSGTGKRGGAGKRGGGGGGGGGSGTRGRMDSDWAEQRPPGRPLLCLPERAVCRLCAQLESGQVHREAWRRGETRRWWRRRRQQRHARAD